LHRPTCSKVFELFDSTEVNGGKGLRATSDFKAGDEISRESAVMRCPNGHPAMSVAEAEEMHRQCVSDRFKSLTAKNQRAVMDLSFLDKYNNSETGEVTRSYGIYQTNSLVLTGKDAGDGAIFLAMCRANHSCRPNVHFCWREDIQKLLIMALKDIAVGDELYGTYGPPEPMETAGRREHLSKEFGFNCMCSMCVAADEDGGDTRMREVKRLCDEVRTLVLLGNHAEAIDSIDRCLVLLTEQGIGEEAGVGARQLLNLAYQLALMGLKDKELARTYLERELKIVDTFEGVGSPVSLAIQEKLVDF
jgi:hypothetical protein